MDKYDYKPRFQIQFQSGRSSERLIHITRFEWTEGDVTESTIISHKSKTYRASVASYTRVANLVNRLSKEKMGRIEVWITWPGWDYMSYGKELEHVDSHR